jgi:hypothetical protein
VSDLVVGDLVRAHPVAPGIWRVVDLDWSTSQVRIQLFDTRAQAIQRQEIWLYVYEVEVVSVVDLVADLGKTET